MVGTPIGVALGRLAAAAPDRTALSFQGRTVTRGELERRTNRLARAYQELGVVPDSFVTIGLSNGIEFVEAAIATWKAGATPQPVSSRLPRRERETLLALANPSVAVGLPEAATGCPVVPSGYFPDPALSDEPLRPLAAASWKAPTSGGSTGRPKLIVSTRPATAGSVAWIGQAFLIDPDGVALITGPLYHNAPFSSMAAALLLGCRLVIMDRFDAARTLELIERERVTWTFLVPTMMQRIMRLPERNRARTDMSSLRTVLHMAAPCPAWLKRAWIDWLGPDVIWEVYGGTEAQAATRIDGRDWLEHEGSVGRPFFGKIKIADADGAELPPGRIGTVWMRPDDERGPTYRYVGSTAVTHDGWDSLGDLGWMDPDGYLHLADREADMILVGGANVYPAEVEAALDEHPMVLSSCVIGLPDDDLGNVVHAIVQLREPVSDEELHAHMAERLVRYKLPRSYERVTTPLRDDAGKVRRRALLADRLAANPR